MLFDAQYPLTSKNCLPIVPTAESNALSSLRPQPFVAEVLLYDRLIIPCPSDTEDRERWANIGRQPDLLDRNLDILGDVAIRVPWDQRKRDTFKTRFAGAKVAAFDAALATAIFSVPLVIASASGLLSVAAFAKLERKPKLDAGECEAAAMIHDVQKTPSGFDPLWHL